MFPGWLLILIALIYIGLLFAIAWQGDQKSSRQHLSTWPALSYSLALGVYCTAWIFYGSVGQASQFGLVYLPHFIGPILSFVIFWPVINKMICIAKRQNITSLADFIASRYGKCQALAAFTSLIVVWVTLPYIALQFKALSMSFAVLTGEHVEIHKPLLSDTGFYLASLMALFAILFGTRRPTATEHHHGLTKAIAFESCVKLGVMLVLAVMVIYLTRRVYSTNVPLKEFFSLSFHQIYQPLQLYTEQSMWLKTLLSMLAVICVPGLFHISVIEYRQQDNINKARWLFPLYMLILAVAILPLAHSSQFLFSTHQFEADTFLLYVANFFNNSTFALLIFLGGFAAATSMVILAAITLAIMISNEMIIPILLHLRLFDPMRRRYTRWLLYIRRIVIILVITLAYLVYRAVASSTSLSELGWLSIAGLVQLTPALLGGMYWKKGNLYGVSAGLTLGLGLWAYILLMPMVINAGILPATWLTSGPMNLSWLNPLTPFNLNLANPFSQGIVLSLGVNIAAYIIISQLFSQRLIERIQASLFVDNLDTEPQSINRAWMADIHIGDLKTLCQRFLDSQQVEQQFDLYIKQYSGDYSDTAQADIATVRFSEQLLASAIGASSARVVINSVLSGRGIEISDVISIIDEASQVLAFSRSLLQSTVENLQLGISVVDHQHKLVVWNNRFLSLFHFPDNFIRVGIPLERIIRFNAYRGEYGPGDPEELVAQLMRNLNAGRSLHFQRYCHNKTVLDIQGNPMANGGFVFTYTDITQQKQIEEALIRSENNIRIYTDNVPALIAYFDTQCRYLFTNRAYEKMMHVERQQILHKRASEVISTEEWQQREPWVKQALAGTQVSYEMKVTTDKGEHRYLQATYTPHYNQDRQILGFFSLYQDITERRAAELALKETNEHLEERVRERTRALSHLNRALREENRVRAAAEQALRQAKQVAETANISKTRFLAAASHDLLQPLNAARLFTSALAQQNLTETQNQNLAHIDSSLQAAEALLETLLDISKLDAGVLTPKRQVVPLSLILEPLYAQFEVIAVERGLELKMAETQLCVNSDPHMLRRILQNFLSNALRYTQYGRVLLGIRRLGKSFLKIEVWDTGPGIEVSKRLEIFQEFHRLDQASRHRESDKGLGLGLSIADRMAKVLEHPLELRSWVGHGTVFSLTVPRSECRIEPETQKAKRLNKSNNPLQNLTILCIDNERVTLAGMQALLTGWDCNVLCATSIHHAKSIIRQYNQQPIAILADYHLDDGVTGIMALDALSEWLGGIIPGIIITADRTENVCKEVKLAGYALLNKPVKPAALRALLTRTIQAHRAKSA